MVAVRVGLCGRSSYSNLRFFLRQLSICFHKCPDCDDAMMCNAPFVGAIHCTVNSGGNSILVKVYDKHTVSLITPLKSSNKVSVRACDDAHCVNTESFFLRHDDAANNGLGS